jgi:hypothetical protein
MVAIHLVIVKSREWLSGVSDALCLTRPLFLLQSFSQNPYQLDSLEAGGGGSSLSGTLGQGTSNHI